MQPILRNFSIEKGDAVNVVFLLTQLAPTGSVPLDPTGSTFELVVSWPGGSITRSTANGTLMLTVGAAATQVKWALSEEETASLPLGGTTYAFARITPGGGRRTYATGSVKALPWGFSGPGDVGIGISTNAGEPIIALEVTDYGVISASTDTAVAASLAADQSRAAAATSETKAAQAAAAAVGTGRIYDTLAQLQADLSPAAGVGGQVLADGDNTGLYVKTGAPSAGGWSIVSRVTLPGLVEAALAYLLFPTIKGDGENNDTAGLQAYAAYCSAGGRTFTLPKPKVAYRLSDTLSLRYLAVDCPHTNWLIDHDGVGIILGGNASRATNPDQSIGNVARAAGRVTTVPDVRIIGFKGGTLRTKEVPFIHIFAQGTSATNPQDYSTGYSVFHFPVFNKLHIDTTGGGQAWVNENDFHLKRCLGEVIIDGEYRHNHNFFHRGTFEGPRLIDIRNGSDNKFFGLRLEGGPLDFRCGPNSERNVAWRSWAASFGGGPASLYDSGAVTDLGKGNKVMNENAMYNDATVVASADISDVVINNRDPATTLIRRTPTLQRIGALGGNAEVLVTDLLPAVKDDCFICNWEGADLGDTVRYRTKISMFDKNQQPVPATLAMVLTAGVWTISGNSISPSVGQATGPHVFITQAAIDAGVAFVRLAVLGSSGALQNALARRITIVNFSTNRVNNVAGVNKGRDVQPNRIVVTAVPTQGFVPMGFECVKNDNTAIYRPLKSIETLLTTTAVAGANAIELASIANIVSGDRIGINMDNRDTYWSTVSGAPNGSIITISGTLPAGAAVGSRVVVVRWATIAQTIT